MKKIFLYTVAIITTFSTSSCTNDGVQNISRSEESSNRIASFEDYYKFISSDTKNKVIIQNIGSAYTNEKIQSVSAISKGGNKVLEFFANGKNYTSDKSFKGSNSTSWSSNENVNSLYGKKLFLNYSNSRINLSTTKGASNVANKGEEDGELSLYIPEIINAKVSGLVNNKIVPGTRVTWNADNLNEKGVVFGVEYSPLAQTDSKIAEQNASRIVRGTTFIDNGSYTITKEDLDKFPNGASLSFYIGRAGYVISNDGNIEEDFSVAAYTAVRSDFDIKY